MKETRYLLMLVSLAILALGIPAVSSQPMTDWELLVPEGTAIKEPLKLASRITTLDGKTIGLRWNGKPNGEILLDKVAQLLKEKVPTLKIIKLYEVERTTIHTEAPGATQLSVEAEAKLIKEKYKPDLVIGSQGD
jgi:hypothetical protein